MDSSLVKRVMSRYNCLMSSPKGKERISFSIFCCMPKHSKLWAQRPFTSKSLCYMRNSFLLFLVKQHLDSAAGDMRCGPFTNFIYLEQGSLSLCSPSLMPWLVNVIAAGQASTTSQLHSITYLPWEYWPVVKLAYSSLLLGRNCSIVTQEASGCSSVLASNSFWNFFSIPSFYVLL